MSTAYLRRKLLDNARLENHLLEQNTDENAFLVQYQIVHSFDGNFSLCNATKGTVDRFRRLTDLHTPAVLCCLCNELAHRSETFSVEMRVLNIEIAALQ